MRRRCPSDAGVLCWLTVLLAVIAVAPPGWSGEIHEAAQAGEVENIQAILAETPEAIREVDRSGWTALHLAAQFGQLEAVKVLLAAKADVNAANPKGWTPLLLAVREDRLDIAKLLIAAKAELNVHDPDGNGLLCLAMGHGDAKLVNVLIDAGVDIQAADGGGCTPLYRAVTADEPSLALVTLLLDKGAEVNAGSHFRTLVSMRQVMKSSLNSPLNAAVVAGRMDLVKLLLKRGADIEATSLDPKVQVRPECVCATPLGEAVALNNAEMVECLLAAGANPDAADVMGTRPLERAIYQCDKAMVALLLKFHADPNAPGRDKKSLVFLAKQMSASRETSKEIAEMLIAAGGVWNEKLEDEAITQTRSVAAVQNLKALATAQAQFIKRMDFYSDSGNALNANGTLIAADLKNAFEKFEGNDDQEKAVPKAGYIFRMLAGDGKDKNGFRKEKGSHELNTWAATARPVDGKGKQFFITEAGTVYGHDDPGDGTFLLDAMPEGAFRGELPPGWTTAK